MKRRGRICIVTSLHLSYNPRVLKEADAFHESGYAVRVVAMRQEADKYQWDESLMSTRSWRLQTLNACPSSGPGRFRWAVGAVRQKLHQRARLLRLGENGLEKSLNRYYPEMCRLAADEPADLFIAHNLQALPVAAFAARKWKARLGFDAEDFHRGEIAPTDSGRAPERSLIIAVEQKYLPQCDYLTAASDGISDAYRTALGILKPVTILNVFPLSERAGNTQPEELRAERRGRGLSLYWYSQVVGRDRGLEDVLNAMALLGYGVHLHIRGTLASEYGSVLESKARDLGIGSQVHFLPPVPPEQLVERAAQHDVGLALETGRTENRRISVTNKLLNYFLAGLAVAATDVPGQRGILERAPGAGFLFSPGDTTSLASRIRGWLDSPHCLAVAKMQSRALGESRFCWDREKHKLLEAVTRIL